MTFGEKLKTLRKENGYSQEQFAALLDVSRQAASKWESDRGFPETEKLLQISSLFGVTLDYLLKDELSAETPAPAGYYVSHEKIDGFLRYKRHGAARLCAGVGAVVLSGAWDGLSVPWPLDTLLYWALLAGGISLIVWHVCQPRQYRELSTKPLLYDEAVLRAFRAECDRNRRIYAGMIVLGVLLLLLGPELALALRPLLPLGVCGALETALTAAWLMLFLYAGIMMRAETMLAQNAEFVAKHSPHGKFTWLYGALPAAGLATAIGLVTNAWSPFLPGLLLLCALLATICKLLLEGRNDK